MHNSQLSQIRLNYSRLNRVLISLGFERRVTPDFTAYREANHDAVIVLPAMNRRVMVSHPHLVAVSNTITGKGVATTDHLYTLLMQYGNPPSSATTVESAKSNGVLSATESSSAQDQGDKKTKVGWVIKNRVEKAKSPSAKKAIIPANQTLASHIKEGSSI